MTVVSRDPEFTPLDLARLLASRRKDGELGPHGIPLSEALDPANQFAFDAPEKPSIDWAEKTALDQMDRYYKTRPKGESRNGHRWGRVTRRS